MVGADKQRIALATLSLTVIGLSACSASSDTYETGDSAKNDRGYIELGDFGLAARELDQRFALETNLDDWVEVKKANCDRVRAGQTDHLPPSSAEGLEAWAREEVALLAWAASITEVCPVELRKWDWTPEETIAFDWADPGWRGWLSDSLSSEPETPPRPTQVPAPVPPQSTGPMTESELQAWVDFLNSLPDSTGETIPGGDGYAVTCEDGTISYSGGIQGACSWHGGVAD